MEKEAQPITTVPPSAPPGNRQGRTARLGNWNLGIAGTHRLATQFVGLQLSAANLLALAVSAASILAGTVTVAAQNAPSNWLLLTVAGLLGLGLALLIEGLTLGSLIRLRVANRRVQQIEDQFDREVRTTLATLPVPDPTQPDASRAMRQYRRTVRLVRHDSRRACRQFTRRPRQQRRFALPFALMGATASTIAGGLFYHTILAGLGQIESLALAAFFALVVTGTFVSSEIHKDAHEEAIKEGFGGGALIETAIHEETKLQSALVVHQQVVAYLTQPEARQVIEEGAHHLLADILTDLRTTSRRLAGPTSIHEETRDATRRSSPLLPAVSQRPPDPGNRSVQLESPDKATTPSRVVLSEEKRQESSASGERHPHQMPPTPLPCALPVAAAPPGETANHGRPEDDRVKRTPSSLFLPSAEHESPDRTTPVSQSDQPEDPTAGVLTWQETASARQGRPNGTGRTRHDVSVSSPVFAFSQDQEPPETRLGRLDGSRQDQPGERTVQQDAQPSADTPVARPETTAPTATWKISEHDSLTARLLAYLAEHPQAKQADIASALGITVRTVQRKLAALRKQDARDTENAQDKTG